VVLDEQVPALGTGLRLVEIVGLSVGDVFEPDGGDAAVPRQDSA
jgi:hypothetical protein